MNAVEVDSITLKRDERSVLEQVSLVLKPGQLLGLIGPNGVGKTTLLKVILGFLHAERGVAYIKGKPVMDYSLSERAQLVAYLPQEREVHWPLTVRRVVALGRHPHLQAWQKLSARDVEVIDRVMKETDVFHLADRPINELAGGEKALSLLARVLASEPEIILVDEPVAGLDPNHQIQVMEVLKRYTQNGKSVLVVLHDLSLAARFCHELCLIHEGKVLAAGEPSAVLSEENLKKSFHIEAKYGSAEDEFYVVPWRRL